MNMLFIPELDLGAPHFFLQQASITKRADADVLVPSSYLVLNVNPPFSLEPLPLANSPQ